jgi:RimJ/RimL family protein N-acetyltransferase
MERTGGLGDGRNTASRGTDAEGAVADTIHDPPPPAELAGTRGESGSWGTAAAARPGCPGRPTGGPVGPPPAPAYPAPTPPPPTPGSRIGGPPRHQQEAGPLDSIADWPASRTSVGMLQLVPVRLGRDLRLISAWMNDPAVAAFWELPGPDEVTARHLRSQLDGDGRSVPCLGVLDGVPMSYWEIYRADLDPLARHYPARPHDTGLHVLLGKAADRGRGVGTALLRAVADLVLDQRPQCGRVLAEPDVRNAPSVAAFLSAGFRYAAEVRLPAKRAALLIRDRGLRTVL